ncbi:MAG: c-type cytochrome [Verrucomicrobiota bacterium]|nr:c-type cytochrome [Verrucomicrobiota bacterium]
MEVRYGFCFNDYMVQARLTSFCVLFITALNLYAAAIHPAVLSLNREDVSLHLFAEAPDIVTPVGMVVDSRGRLYVIESHTHQRPDKYAGPESDRVKIFEDLNRDGRADRITIFAEGFYAAMNLVLTPKGELLLVHRNGVMWLQDNNQDDRADKVTELLRLQTEERYPHNGLGGAILSEDGWLYVGMGENLGRSYTLTGSDGKEIRGGGEGGNVFRCRVDGSGLERYATGFWNPFAFAFGKNGELFTVDNDPDSRPPCRLLHVIRHGDYGYQFRYGRSGLHPFVSWNGEIPGTLGMVAGTGEAPSGMLNLNLAGWGGEDSNALLVTGWGDNTLELFRLTQKGASFSSQKVILIQGDKSFRPVAIATQTRASATADAPIYITDWADQEYSVHKKGRIWSLGKNGKIPEIQSEPTAAAMTLTQLQHDPQRFGFDRLLLLATNMDAFISSAAIHALSAPEHHPDLRRALSHTNDAIRLAAVLALRRGDYKEPSTIVLALLTDPSVTVRQMALTWAAEKQLPDLEGDLARALELPPVTPALFKVYLAARELMKPQTEEKSVWAQGSSGDQLLLGILNDSHASIELQRLALLTIEDIDSDTVLKSLEKAVGSTNESLKIAAVRALAFSKNEKAGRLLWQVASNQTAGPGLRGDAIAGLAHFPKSTGTNLFSLLEEREPVVATEAARTVRTLALADEQFLKKLEQFKKTTMLRQAALDQLQMLITPAVAHQPGEDSQWMRAAQQQGDAGRGRRVFFNPLTSCSKCHSVEGRGGKIGPDLSTIGRGSDRVKLAHSILEPSRDIGPLYVSHQITLKDGGELTGLILNRGSEYLEMETGTGSAQRIPVKQIEREKASEFSLMPAGLETTMTPNDFSDLISYLLSLR